ncbi:MAG TPA: TIGR01458 family HAD-type hydrolase [Thermoanaerobaculia bacterium]|jgi:HAD superfamily hydrolase (TIGR01458 family)
MSALSGIRALLVDLEGTVFQDGALIPGAAQALGAAAARGLDIAFVTNTTSRPRSILVRELAEMGIPIDADAVFSAARVAREYLLGKGYRRCHLLTRPSLAEDFAGIVQDDVGADADAVVLGDLGDTLSFERLNRALRLLVGDVKVVELVALARNRFWMGKDGIMLDVGPLVAALEYASGTTATLVGKPSPEFFGTVLRALSVSREEAAVIGDDPESDVSGAQALGMRGLLVRTGKSRRYDLERSAIRPDAVLDSIADLPGML